jgi:hypothetical protein
VGIFNREHNGGMGGSMQLAVPSVSGVIRARLSHNFGSFVQFMDHSAEKNHSSPYVFTDFATRFARSPNTFTVVATRFNRSRQTFTVPETKITF